MHGANYLVEAILEYFKEPLFFDVLIQYVMFVALVLVINVTESFILGLILNLNVA